jgi:hypothetical protein
VGEKIGFGLLGDPTRRLHRGDEVASAKHELSGVGDPVAALVDFPPPFRRPAP